MDLTGKHAVVTGASRGIGAEVARLFAASGAKVTLLARGQREISALAQDIGENAFALPCNVASYDAVAAALSAAESIFGPVDILINNAGMIEPISHLASADAQAWSDVVDVNLKGVFYGMRVVLPGMIERGEGTILNISSGAANNPLEGWSHYCASKAGAQMLTRAAHKEAGDKGVRILGLSPGTVATQMQKEIKASGLNPVSELAWEDHIPPDWPARALLWMCTPDADEFRGTDISLRDEDIRRRVGLI